jgi:hypothetical protein
MYAFDHPVSGVGAQMGYDVISSTPFPFTEALNLYDLGTTCSSRSRYLALLGDAADNSAVFIGATDTFAEIASAEFFTPTTSGPFPGAFTMNEVSLVADPLPEPASLALLAAALTGFAVTRRRRGSCGRLEDVNEPPTVQPTLETGLASASA